MINWKGDKESLTIPEMVCRLNKAEQSMHSRPALTEGERIVNYIKQVRGLEKVNRRLKAQIEPLESRTARELLSAHDDLNDIRLAYNQLSQKNKDLLNTNMQLKTISTNENFALLKSQMEDDLTAAHDDLSELRRENRELRSTIKDDQQVNNLVNEQNDAIYEKLIVKNNALKENLKIACRTNQTIWQTIKNFWKLK
jgi:hypothetical protein